jgi:hypothetical protein
MLEQGCRGKDARTKMQADKDDRTKMLEQGCRGKDARGKDANTKMLTQRC